MHHDSNCIQGILAEDARKSDIGDLIATPFAQSYVVTTSEVFPLLVYASAQARGAVSMKYTGTGW